MDETPTFDAGREPTPDPGDEVTVVLDAERWTGEREGRLELAQIVWLRALDVQPAPDRDELEDAMVLVKLARNHRAVLEHALSHGRALLQRRRTDTTLANAVRDLERALSLVRPGGATVIPHSHLV